MYINPLKIEKRQTHINPLNRGSICFRLPVISNYGMHDSLVARTENDTIGYNYSSFVQNTAPNPCGKCFGYISVKFGRLKSM